MTRCSGTHPVPPGVPSHAYPGVRGDLPDHLNRVVRDLTLDLQAQRNQLPAGLRERPDLTSFDLTRGGDRVVLTVTEYYEPARPLSRGDDPDGPVPPVHCR